MQRKTLATILFSILPLSCGGSDSPEVHPCVLNEPASIFNCSSNKNSEIHYNLTYQGADKYIALSPDHWEAREKYVKKLKQDLITCQSQKSQ